MTNPWLLFALVLGFLGSCSLLLWPWWRRRQREQWLQRARASFHFRREWLEAHFLTLAGRSGKPRGLRWMDCDFEDEVAFARDKNTGNLRALVAVAIRFEAVEGGGMEDVEAVDNLKAATVVFRLDGPSWEADGRPLFNLNPAQTIEHYRHELETVDEVSSG